MKVIEPGRVYQTDDGQLLHFVGAGRQGTTTEELAEILAHRHQVLAQEGNGWPRWHELMTCFRGIAYLLRARREFLDSQARGHG